MARRLVFGWAVMAALWCGHAMAVGLGEIKIHSALNQKLDAEIELLDTRGMQQSEILAQLASADDFTRVGVERFFFLTDLKFRVEVAANGSAVLHITSDAPITEPYLNFLVQVMWPSGRLLKEYTVLLDPPTYKDEAAPPVAVSPGRSDPGGGPAGRVERTPTRPDSQVSLRSAPRSTQPATPPQAPQDRLTGDSYGMTDRDDTLWAIAQRARPSNDVSVQQSMLAIVRLNPQAFIGGNINLLKAGYKLRLPTEAETAELSKTDAINQVAEQNQAWQAYRRGEPLTAVAASSAPPPAAETPALAGQMDATTEPVVSKAPTGPDGELRIVAGDNVAGGTGAGGGAADAAALEGQLAATKEETDRITRERDEAVGRLDQVTSQAEQAQRQIEVRDKQIAQLQEQMKALQAKAGNTTPAGTTKKEPAAGILALLTSPLVLIGGAIVLVLIVVAGLMRARSNKAADDEQLVRYNVPAARNRETKPIAAVGASEEFSEAPEEEPAEQELKLHEEDREPVHHEGAQTGDVIGEADIYIAYGRYPQAVSLLLGALDEDPDRSDVRLKLLEVYAETKAEAGFETQMQELLTRCDDNELLLEARELEAKLRENDTVVQAVASNEPEPPATLDDFQLDLDAEDDVSPPRRAADIVADRRTAEPEPEPVREATDDGHSDDLGGDLGIDFKADDDATVLRPAASRKPERGGVVVATATDEDEFDLEDIEYDPAPRRETTGAAKTNAKADESDDAFDFLNEEDAATTKLDLARAYIDMGDEDGAREILGEVLQEGSNEQQQTANELLAKMG
jgi:pilus assembly protein FimV